MTRGRLFCGAAAALVLSWSCSEPSRSIPTEVRSSSPQADNTKGLGVAQEQNAQVCPGPARGFRCHAFVVVDPAGSPKSTSGPSGLSPTQLTAAYNLPAIALNPQTIAIIDAYDAPNIKSDLDTYSAQFGLQVLPVCNGPVASATNKPCFRKEGPTGSTSDLPTPDASWAVETSLDVETVHGVCPNCSVLLVEAISDLPDDLMAAFDRAVTEGARIISNSYGGDEFATETAVDSHFNLSGYAIVFSSGDNAKSARVQWPAASPYVTAVGGTTLTLTAAGAYLSESAWSGAVSGCSEFENKPAFQSDPSCSKRTIADISADAGTAASIYDSFKYKGKSGWLRLGGTSLATPIIAGVYGLAGGVPSSRMGNALLYSNFNYATNLHDVTSGSSGKCGGSYLCAGAAGYDGPTGLGTPDGLGAWSVSPNPVVRYSSLTRNQVTISTAGNINGNNGVVAEQPLGSGLSGTVKSIAVFMGGAPREAVWGIATLAECPTAEYLPSGNCILHNYHELAIDVSGPGAEFATDLDQPVTLDPTKFYLLLIQSYGNQGSGYATIAGGDSDAWPQVLIEYPDDNNHQPFKAIYFKLIGTP